jgi:hypothetical protein
MFFAEPPGRLKIAWHNLTGDLVAVGKIIAPDEIAKRSFD